jgi:cell division protein FtsZ
MIRFVEKPSEQSSTPRMRVVGFGGCGQNAVDRMINQDFPGVEFVAVNTDAQVLARSLAPLRIQIGSKLTRGLGAGGEPEIGRAAALEDADRLRELCRNTDMIFITAGMGGGTGTGAAPVFAELARECEVLTVAVVTKPFRFEGAVRTARAEEGIRELRRHADALLIVPNQKLLTEAPPDVTVEEAFRLADDVLCQAVRGASELISCAGYINLDIEDARKIMARMGLTLMGTVECEGEDRAMTALQKAVNPPLLENVTINGAKGVLINITGGSDLTLKEIDDINTRIYEQAARDANIIWGYVIDNRYTGKIKLTIIATGFDPERPAVQTTSPARTRARSEPAPAPTATPRRPPAPQPRETTPEPAEQTPRPYPVLESATDLPTADVPRPTALEQPPAAVPPWTDEDVAAALDALPAGPSPEEESGAAPAAPPGPGLEPAEEPHPPVAEATCPVPPGVLPYRRRTFQSLARMSCKGDGSVFLDRRFDQFPTVMVRYTPTLGPRRAEARS